MFILMNPFSLCSSMFCFPISDHMMFSWEFSFCFFITYCIWKHLKETIPKRSIMWSEIGKQNVQAKRLYAIDLYIVTTLITGIISFSVITWVEESQVTTFLKQQHYLVICLHFKTHIKENNAFIHDLVFFVWIGHTQSRLPLWMH